MFSNHSAESLCPQYSRNALKLQGETGKLRWIYSLHGGLARGLSQPGRGLTTNTCEGLAKKTLERPFHPEHIPPPSVFLYLEAGVTGGEAVFPCEVHIRGSRC